MQVKKNKKGKKETELEKGNERKMKRERKKIKVL